MKRNPAHPRRILRTLRPPRAIVPADQKRIVRELNLRCRPSDRGDVSFAALRLRAIVMLAGGAALRIAETCALEAFQVVDHTGPRWTLRSLAYLRASQAKGRRKGPQQWHSAGTFMVADTARQALRAYIVEARKRGYLSWPPKPGETLFMAVRGNGQVGPGRRRLSVRTLQQQWLDFQRRAGVPSPYHFHCLRHTAMTACSDHVHGNPATIAAFGRCDVVTALRYVRGLSPAQMLELRNPLAFG